MSKYLYLDSRDFVEVTRYRMMTFEIKVFFATVTVFM